MSTVSRYTVTNVSWFATIGNTGPATSSDAGGFASAAVNAICTPRPSGSTRAPVNVHARSWPSARTANRRRSESASACPAWATKSGWRNQSGTGTSSANAASSGCTVSVPSTRVARQSSSRCAYDTSCARAATPAHSSAHASTTAPPRAAGPRPSPVTSAGELAEHHHRARRLVMIRRAAARLQRHGERGHGAVARHVLQPHHRVAAGIGVHHAEARGAGGGDRPQLVVAGGGRRELLREQDGATRDRVVVHLRGQRARALRRRRQLHRARARGAEQVGPAALVVQLLLQLGRARPCLRQVALEL